MVRINACAKLNLMLCVKGKRADGFHDIVSIMQTLSLFDGVSVEKAETLTLECNRADIPLDKSNLAFAAAELFFDESGINGGAAIRLDKRIPACAGLGGGSADAAAVLKALDALYGTDMGTEVLCRIGGRLGSDVPFCLKGGTCLATGRGEVLTRLPHLKLHYVLLFGTKALSTPYMYGRLDERGGADFDAETCVRDWQCGNTLSALRRGGNSFYSLAAAEDASVTANRTALLECGAAYACISGKGPTVFGVFESRAVAETASDALGGLYCHSADTE